MPAPAWTESALHEFLERQADELGLLISRMTAAGVPAADLAPLSRLHADLRRALESANTSAAALAELRERAGRVLRQFVDAEPGGPRPTSAELRSGSGGTSSFWRPAAG
jgi:hypothetical protein